MRSDETGRSGELNPPGFWQRATASTVVGLASFVVLGTVAAVWPNPLFIRMVPTAGYELPLLAAQSILVVLYLGFRRPACGVRRIGLASAINFLGVACPICNKVLLLTFGATTLLTYFEPVRLYVGVGGVVLGLLAVLTQLVPSGRSPPPALRAPW